MAQQLAFRDGIMDRIRMRETRFHEHAYLFVLSALEFCQQRLPERRHITGAELVMAPADPDYGGRLYSCRDPEGHLWNFGTYDPWE